MNGRSGMKLLFGVAATVVLGASAMALKPAPVAPTVTVYASPT